MLPSSVEKYNVETVAVDTLILDSCRVERVALLPCINCTVRELPCSVEKYNVETVAVDTLILDSCRVERVASLP